MFVCCYPKNRKHSHKEANAFVGIVAIKSFLRTVKHDFIFQSMCSSLQVFVSGSSIPIPIELTRCGQYK